jgi:hypothetical protein
MKNPVLALIVAVATATVLASSGGAANATKTGDTSGPLAV